MSADPSFYAYWGKARPASGQSDRYHLLAFHSLDVAACGRRLLRLPQFSVQNLARDLKWSLAAVEDWCVLFLVLHDLGKFSRGFQGLMPDLAPALVPACGARYDQRHDTLGWLLWRDQLAEQFPDERFSSAAHEIWSGWMRATTGHHGQPPKESVGGGVLQAHADDFFLKEDAAAARSFVSTVSKWLLPQEMTTPTRANLSAWRWHSWRLAGFAVLADWLGSNQSYFSYRASPMELQEYWQTRALAGAEAAVSEAGLRPSSVRAWSQPLQMFDYLHEPTPLQRYATEVPLQASAQLFLLEDVTGAGKTEAALILAQRLMQAGLAQGIYFALPSMATANQMYRRVGSVYRQLYEPEAQPSLILAHGARELVESFRASILQKQAQPSDYSYALDELSASAQCNAWLADNRKKALLAEVGVGTVDQALLAVLPVRHQSLRALGLSAKVLIVDEVHAYDPYVMTLLRGLLTLHARQGGSVILLSATLPLASRESLIFAYQKGLGSATTTLPSNRCYPVAIQAGVDIKMHACQTRPQSKRKVLVRQLRTEADAIELILRLAREGRCIGWIRNTVGDATSMWDALRRVLPSDDLILFHSRYVMGDRLQIEDLVLSRFGKHSTAADRRGKVLIGTQVLEQSLDIDVDVMIVDLAPIDLILQRAGRLQRHARGYSGEPAADGIERRDPPMVYLLTPAPVDDPAADWYSAMFPKASFIYPDVGGLWRGARALLRAGSISTPGDAAAPDGVRGLIEAVYGEQAEAIPDQLQRSSHKQAGRALAEQSQGLFNCLNIEAGYCIDSSGRWEEDERVPTRLGDETLTLFLAAERDGILVPLKEGMPHAWEQSAVRIDARHAAALSSHWQQAFGSRIDTLRRRVPLLDQHAFVLPVMPDTAGVLMAEVIDKAGRTREFSYDARRGLDVHGRETDGRTLPGHDVGEGALHLLRSNWVAVRGAEGDTSITSAAEISNPRWRDLIAPRADFRGALYQFFIGLLQTTFAPTDMDEWWQRWACPPTEDDLKRAFAPWQHAFVLEAATGPAFMQDLSLPDTAHQLSVLELLIDAGSDSNRHFNKPTQAHGQCEVCFFQALLTLQLNAPSGGRGGRTSVRGGGPLTTLLMPVDESASLWQRLWLNVMPIDAVSNAPVGELGEVLAWLVPTRASEGAAAVETPPHLVHPLQAYWSMSRRVRLDASTVSAGTCAVCGRTHARLIHHYRTRHGGTNYTGAWMHPLTPYSLDPKREAPPVSIKGRQAGRGYRHWLGLVLGNEAGQPAAAKVVSHFNSHVRRLPVRLWCFGYETDNMKAVCWYDSTLPVHSVPDAHQRQFTRATKQLLDVAVETAQALQRQVKAARFRRPSEQGSEPAIPRSFWQDSERGFYKALETLAAACGHEECVQAGVLKGWLHETQRIALALFDQWVSVAPMKDIDLKRVVRARADLIKQLNHGGAIKPLWKLIHAQQETVREAKKV